MNRSIRFQLIVALNLFVVGLALLFGWVAQDSAGTLVEERYVKDMAESAAHYLRNKPFRETELTMRHLHDLFHAEWAIGLQGRSTISVSSLSAPERVEFQARRTGRLRGLIHLGGRLYRYDSVPLASSSSSSNYGQATQLYMLVPEETFLAARAKTQSRITGLILPAAVVATGLGLVFALTLTRSIRRLARKAASITLNAIAHPAQPHLLPCTGPREVRQLSASFDEMLQRLGRTQETLLHNEQLATLGKVALGLSHELRNPLSGIVMNLRVLQDHDALADDPSIQAILRETGRMDGYLKELLNLSPNVSAASSALQPAPQCLSAIVGDTLTVLQGRLRHLQLQAQLHAPDDEPTVDLDAARIRQVVMNLLINAIEASPPGGSIEIELTHADAQVRLAIRDFGSGVAEDAGDIFQSFVTHKPDGVGLGLHISKQIVERHGGGIGYENVHPGARFFFTLPLSLSRNSQP